MTLKDAKRVVVLQTASQVRHYSEQNRQESDLIIPIGPEAMYHAEKCGWATCKLGELWSSEDYKQAAEESQQRIDSLIDALDAYSKRWNAKLSLEIGRYYALQLWVIIGQIHYNHFIAHSIVHHLEPIRMLVYTKDVDQPFLELRPDPDCIFANVLLRTPCIHAVNVELQRISEKRSGKTVRERVINFLPLTFTTQLRELRNRLRIRSTEISKYNLLLIGAGYDWFKISQYEVFRKLFTLHTLPRQMSKGSISPPAELVNLLNDSVVFSGDAVFGLESLAASIYDDMVLYAGQYEGLKKKLGRYDAVVTAVLTFPWDNYLAHLATRMNIPVVVWQHGEKGQYKDFTVPYTELYYATNYLAYAPAVQKQYQSWVGKSRLLNVEAVGSFGKNVAWKGGGAIVYATGKWCKTAVSFVPNPDPDERLFVAHKTILDYLEVVAAELPVTFKANNTNGLNAIPYQYSNVRVDYATPFTTLLETAGIIILDTPATTLVEACSTKVPIFVLGGRAEYHHEFIEVIKRRVAWCETPSELVKKIDLYLREGLYEADVEDDTYLAEYCAAIEPDEVVKSVNKGLLYAIGSCAEN